MPNVMLKLLDDEFLIAHDARYEVADPYDADHVVLDCTQTRRACPWHVVSQCLLSLSRSALHGNRMYSD
jgi:hypothetical protein